MRGAAPAALGQLEHAVGEFSDGRYGPRVAAQAQRLLKFRGQLRRLDRVFRKRGGEQGLGGGERFLADHRRRARRRLLGRRFAKLELKTPAMLADFGIGPDFERADFGQLRAELDGHQALARFAEAQNGVQRGVQMRLAVRRSVREFDYIAGLVLGARTRTVEAERYRLVGY